jgi:hypothetical protein
MINMWKCSQNWHCGAIPFRVYFLLLPMCVHFLVNSAAAQAPNPLKSLPFEVTVIETSAAKESKEIKTKALTYLLGKDYDRLDQLAATLRSSKQSWANGTWKLSEVYVGLVPSRTATETEWKARMPLLRDWMAVKPKSITARVALAFFLTEYGWQARGSGWASTVTPDGWRLFEQRLLEAVQTLKGSEELGLRCPVGWFVLMRAGLGLNMERSQFDSVFEKAKRFAPDYKAYYFRRSVYLLPRWNGKPGEWELDLAKSCDKIGGEKGDELYAQVVWFMHHSANFKNIFTDNQLSWDRVDQGFGVIEKDFPDSLAAKSERAHLAALASDVVKARKYLQQTGGKVDLSEWKTKDEYIRFAVWAYGH